MTIGITGPRKAPRQNAVVGWILAGAAAVAVGVGAVAFIVPALTKAVPPPAFPGNTKPVLAVIGAKPFQDYSVYLDRVFERTEDLGLEIGKDLVLLETVGDAELPSWYQAADAFIFPSIKEGWGLAVLEAMAAGLPVITSDIPVFREYLTDGRDVVMTPAGNATALADAMVRVATDAGLRSRLQQAGPKVASRFTWEACARQHIATYRQL